MKTTAMVAAMVLAAVSVAPELDAGEICFPPGAGIFDAVKDGGLDNTGKIDNTEKLNKLLAGDFGRRLQVFYFPKGTYLVSGMIRGKHDTSRAATSHSHGPWVVGESRTETIIRLKDDTWTKDPFDSKGDKLEKRLDQQVLWHTGDCTNVTFNQIIRNLTLNIGKGNPGAIGMVYITSNTGALQDVDIVSEDGQGRIGLALSGSENGPGQIKGVRIRGFDIGMYNAAPYHMATSRIEMSGIRECGLLNSGLLALEDIQVSMVGAGPAIRNVAGRGRLCLVKGVFDGKAATAPAILNESGMYARDVTATGFARAIESTREKTDGAAPDGAKVAEYFSGQSAGMFNNAKRSLCLEIKTPQPPAWERDFSKWANVKDYKTADNSWSDAMRASLAEKGKTHLVFPFGVKVEIEGTFTVGNDYVRLVGTGGQLAPLKDDAQIIIGDGSAPTVTMEGFVQAPTIIVRTGRTVILQDVGGGGWKNGARVGAFIRGEGTGDLFLDDMGRPVVISNAKQRVWMRHYNNEAKEVALTVQDGQVWLLGWKSENLGQRVRQTGGALEVMGFDSYEVGKDVAGATPIFEIAGGNFSAAMVVQTGKSKYGNLVTETRNGETRTLNAGASPNGANCLLYTGFDPRKLPAP